MPLAASVEFIVTTLGLESAAICSSVLDACRNAPATELPTEAINAQHAKTIPLKTLMIHLLALFPLPVTQPAFPAGNTLVATTRARASAGSETTSTHHTV
jgi:hypothetical protein